jgi:Fic family protein
MFHLRVYGSAPKDQEAEIKKAVTELLKKYGLHVVTYAEWNGTFTGQENLMTGQDISRTLKSEQVTVNV